MKVVLHESPLNLNTNDIISRPSSGASGFFKKFYPFWKIPSHKWPSCFTLDMNNFIIIYKTYFIQPLLRWTWIFRKIYSLLENPQSVALIYLAANGSVVFCKNNLIIVFYSGPPQVDLDFSENL